MRTGDYVSVPPLIQRAIIATIFETEATIWWPCPEYGRHTKIVDVADLVSLNEHYAGPIPARKKDQHLDSQRVKRTDR